MNKTDLFQEHINLGAKMVDFGGWNMPINYGSQINEHKTVDLMLEYLMSLICQFLI